MNLPLLKVELRESSGKGGLKGVRHEGFVPGIVYGHNKECSNVRFDKRELERLLNKYGIGSSIGLQTNDGVKHAIIKDIQRHVIKHHIVHIDFQELSANEKVKVRIPLQLVNKAAVESSTVVIQQQMIELEIQTYPKYLPQIIEVDASNMELGIPLRVKELTVYNDEKIEVVNDADGIVALLTAASKVAEVVEEVTEEEQLRKLY